MIANKHHHTVILDHRAHKSFRIFERASSMLPSGARLIRLGEVGKAFELCPLGLPGAPCQPRGARRAGAPRAPPLVGGVRVVGAVCGVCLLCLLCLCACLPACLPACLLHGVK